jgi:hypothetical protein
MYIYNMNQTVQLHVNYLLKLHVSECGLLYRRKDNLYHHLKEKHQSGVGMQNQPVDINHPDQYYTIHWSVGSSASKVI